MSLKTDAKENFDKIADSTAFQVAAGAGDFAAEKFRQMQDKLAEIDVQATLAQMPQRLADAGEKAQSTLAAVPEKLAAWRSEPKAVQEAVQATAKQLPERAQDLAVQFAGLAVQAYGELAERGRAVVDRMRGVEEIVPERAPSPATTVAAAEVAEAGAAVAAKPVATQPVPKPAPKPAPTTAAKPTATRTKTTTTPRKSTTPRVVKKA